MSSISHCSAAILSLQWSCFSRTIAVLQYATSPNGFDAPPRDWNSFGLQTYDQGQFKLTQDTALAECIALANRGLAGDGYVYCSIDSGWSIGLHGDEYGRVVADEAVFPDVKQLGDDLHSRGLKLGIYINPGAFAEDADKTIYGTTETLRAVILFGDADYVNARWNLDWSDPLAQAWCDANVELWAGWGVDYIKLDYITPGSSQLENDLPDKQDTSGAVSCYQKAIAKVGRDIWLGISWALPWTKGSAYEVYKESADSMRVDQDVNNEKKDTLVAWETVQRTIDKYRQFISYQFDEVGDGTPLTVRPNLDNLYALNNGDLTGLTERQIRTMTFHWIGAGGPLMIGSSLASGDINGWGGGLLHDPVLNRIADFTAKYPMIPYHPEDRRSKGSQGILWVAGPKPNGEVVFMAVNYGNTGNNDLYDPEPVGGRRIFQISINGMITGLEGIDHWEVRAAAKAFYSDGGTTSDGTIAAGQTFNISVADSDAFMFIATPVLATNAKREADPAVTPTRTINIRQAPTPVATQSTYSMESPGCGTQGDINGTVPVGVEIENGTVSSIELLYIIRSMLCTEVCEIPAGVPDAAATTQQSDGAIACEISVAVSNTTEAWGYRGTAPVGVQAQQCWDSTAYIIDRCIIARDRPTGWWNGDHVYQFYQVGVRPLNFNETFHAKAGDNLSSALTTVSTIPSFSTNPFTVNATTSSAGGAIPTLPTAAASTTGGTAAASSFSASASATQAAPASGAVKMDPTKIWLLPVVGGLLYTMWLWY